MRNAILRNHLKFSGVAWTGPKLELVTVRIPFHFYDLHDNAVVMSCVIAGGDGRSNDKRITFQEIGIKKD